MNYACAYTCKIDIGKEGAHLDLASTRPAPQLNLRLACEVFAFGTTGSPVKKGSRDGVFYSTTQPKKLREQQQVTFLTHWDLSCPSPAFSVLSILSPKFVVEPERATLFGHFGDEIYGAVEKRRTWPRVIKLFCGEIGGGVVGRDKQHVTIWGYFLFHFGFRIAGQSTFFIRVTYFLKFGLL